MTELNNRYEFIMLFDCENGNPNGDPDAGNMPRVDAETSIGLVTDVCIKRKIRNYIEIAYEGKPSYNILIKTDRSLNSKFTEAYEKSDLKRGEKGKNSDFVRIARDYMCKNYYDVRCFGAVMNTGDDPCGIVRGPVQINFAHSIDPVLPQEMTITRQAITKDSDKAKKETEMGKKNYIPYGLYRAEGYVSAMLAQKTGFSEEDLNVLWEAIMNMFEHDHSAARGKMSMRKLIIFKHDSLLGNAPSNVLFDKVSVFRKPGVETARSYSDYDVVIDDNEIAGVEIINKL